MRLKQVSKRRWKARMMRGLWIPIMVVEGYSMTAPNGYKLVCHPVEEFVKIWPLEMWHYTVDYQPIKRAWE